MDKLINDKSLRFCECPKDIKDILCEAAGCSLCKTSGIELNLKKIEDLEIEVSKYLTRLKHSCPEYLKTIILDQYSQNALFLKKINYLEEYNCSQAYENYINLEVEKTCINIISHKLYENIYSTYRLNNTIKYVNNEDKFYTIQSSKDANIINKLNLSLDNTNLYFLIFTEHGKFNINYELQDIENTYVSLHHIDPSIVWNKISLDILLWLNTENLLTDPYKCAIYIALYYSTPLFK